MSEVVIREIRLDEVRQMRQVQARSWLATYPNAEHQVSKEWVQQFTDSWLTKESVAEWVSIVAAAASDPDEFSRVAEVDGHIVGLLHAMREDHRVELRSLYIDPSAQGQGIGTALMAAFNAWAGADPTWLDVAVYNERAIRFHQGHGFQIRPGSVKTIMGVIPAMDMVRP